jgi:hypothetical protein
MVILERNKKRRIRPINIIGSKKANITTKTKQIPNKKRLMLIIPFMIPGSALFGAGTSLPGQQVNKANKNRRLGLMSFHSSSGEIPHQDQIYNYRSVQKAVFQYHYLGEGW